MKFSINSPILFVIVALIVAVVLAQSIFFLVKAWKRGIELGMDKKKLKRIFRILKSLLLPANPSAALSTELAR